jgi:hypothetical protein
MAELIIDTPDKHEEVLNLLKEAGISVEDDDTVENVFQVPDSSINQVEEILSANSIEFQWSGEGLDESDYLDEEEEGEEDER